MTEAQYRLFWREWKQCREWYLAHGLTAKQADAKRSELTEQALGYAKSMSNWGLWKNGELDKVLAKFRSVYDGGNLNAQMNAEDQPDQRKKKMQAECYNLAPQIWPLPLEIEPKFIREKKLNAIAYRVCKKRFEFLNDVELGRVLGVLYVQLKRIQARNTDTVPKNPF